MQIGGEQLLDAFQRFSRKPSLEPDPLETSQPSKVYSIRNDTINLILPPRIAQRLNARQLWFLGQLQSRGKGKAEDITTQWGVSIASAKRDIGQLARLKLIRFEGARKTGQYRIRKNTEILTLHIDRLAF